MRRLALAVVAALTMAVVGSPVTAEVKSAGDGRLVLQNSAVIADTPDKVYAALGRIGQWWDPAHSYSGKAGAMTIELKPGACFCEALPDGGVKHGEVVMVMPERTLRIMGAFGPLQATGATGALTFEMKPRLDGGTEVVQTYQVSGLDPAMTQAAPGIDAVIGGQLARLKRYVETGKAD
ncbi:MAG: SRPBCC domain-containing protein [Caulobacter sp.]|nr:SRPBCC domain-containing protein [Caulobacter sp.]